MSFPNRVNYALPAGFAGAWASDNPRRFAVPGPNGFRAGAGGLAIAAFGWVQADGASVLNTGTGRPTGLVCRSQQAILAQPFEEAGMTLPAGFMATLAQGGDVFVLSTTDATMGQAVYAATADGTLSTAAAGSAPEGTVDTGWTVARGGAAGLPIIITGPSGAA